MKLKEKCINVVFFTADYMNNLVGRCKAVKHNCLLK